MAVGAGSVESLDLNSRLLGADLAGKRVFVTGHTGFKGSWMTALLKRLGCDVYGYALSPKGEPNLFELASLRELLAGETIADIRDSSQLAESLRIAQPALVIHMAAQAFVRRSYAEPVDTWGVNVMGTVNLLEAARSVDRDVTRRELFSERYLLKRPLLRALEGAPGRAPVLLIDEIDRADEEFEGYLLELLSEFRVTIPEIGTIVAEEPPIVILTSNRTREVHDALKRRCLYQWIDYPSFEKELAIVQAKVPGASAALAREVTAVVQELRTTELYKTPGVSETLDWVAALVALDREALDPATIDETLGVVLKAREDIEAMRGDRLQRLLARAMIHGARQSG